MGLKHRANAFLMGPLVISLLLLFSFIPGLDAIAQEIQITTDPADQHGPAIWGDYIVYGDDRNGNPDIYLYDIAGSTESPVSTDAAWQRNPAVYGDLVVYEDFQNGNWDIYLFDLSGAGEQQITTDPDTQFFPDIFGDRIIWVDSRNDHPCPGFDEPPNPDLYFYDLSTSLESKACEGAPLDFPPPALWGDRIVWEQQPLDLCYVDCIGGGLICIGPYLYVRMFDFNTSIESSLAGPATYHYVRPDIYEDLVVYNMDDGMYLYNLSTSQETLITPEGGDYPRIYGDYIVYLRSSDIYLYDLSTSTETPLPVGPVLNFPPAVYGNRVVYTADRFGNKDIFMYVIEDSDGDGLLDAVESGYCTDLANPDTDGDGLCDGDTSIGGTCIAGEDMDLDGVVDPGETDPCNADSDGDLMPDGYEVENSLDGTTAGDKYSDADGDSNPNVHEYFNGTLAGDVANPDPFCGPGGYCFGEGGGLPTNGIFDGIDLTEIINYMRTGGDPGSIDYTGVIPPDGLSADLDGTGAVDGTDLTLYTQILGGQWSGDLPGSATQMNRTLPSGSSVTGGGTIEVEVFSSTGKGRAGYGVMFWIDASSTGSGEIYGGDGDTLGLRYDVVDSTTIGKARVYLHVIGGGTIRVNAKIPADASKYIPAVPAAGNLEIELTASQ